MISDFKKKKKKSHFKKITTTKTKTFEKIFGHEHFRVVSKTISHIMFHFKQLYEIFQNCNLDRS
jgi:hypothetical protein